MTEPLTAGKIPIVLIATGLPDPLLIPIEPVFVVNKQVRLPTPLNAFSVVPDELFAPVLTAVRVL